MFNTNPIRSSTEEQVQLAVSQGHREETAKRYLQYPRCSAGYRNLKVKVHPEITIYYSSSDNMRLTILVASPFPVLHSTQGTNPQPQGSQTNMQTWTLSQSQMYGTLTKTVH